MTLSPQQNTLRQYLGELIGLENRIENILARVLTGRTDPFIAEAVEPFSEIARAHRLALEARYGQIGGQDAHVDSGFELLAPLPAAEVRDPDSPNAASRAMHELYVAFNHAALAYGILHAVAHRFFDSQSEGNTADLAEAHLRDYAGAAQSVNQQISDVAIAELDRAGMECRCECPSCGMGLCLCATHGTNTINQAWRETIPPAPQGGIRVRQPRADSVAAQVGLRPGDRIVVVDDQEIPTDLSAQEIQTAIRKHSSGEAIQMRVERSSGDSLELTLTRP